MTATYAEPRPDGRFRSAEPRQSRRGREPYGARRDDNSGLLFATELASFAVTASAIAGMHLLFRDGSFFGPLVFQALLAHLVIGAARRMRIRLLPAALLVAAAAVLAITWTQYMDTAVALLPSPDTFSALDADMDGAWQMFRDVKAPAPVVPGFIAATSLTLWVIVFISDWGAFRTGVSFEALLPQATLFLFAAVLGADSGRAAGAAFFVAAALIFLLLHRTWRQEGTATWAALHRQRGRSSLLVSGCVLIAVAVAGGGIFGPNLPGADDEAIFGWREFTKNREPRQVVSPLVDIQRRLVEQSDQEFFTVRVDDPSFAGAYWRLTALDEFDGRIWRSTYQTEDADGRLEDGVDAETATSRIEQTITVNEMRAIWLPAAFEPVDINTPEGAASVDYDPESSTLIVDNEEATSDGLTYTVVSDIPQWSGEELRGASQQIPGDIEDRYLDLPEDFPQTITEEARTVTAGLDNRWDQAIALQSYFRDSGRFTYDIEAPDKHSVSAIEDFLFQSKTGYCEQFAGSFAAMARSIDIPTRVVVGFTKGRRDVNDPTLFRVTGKQAHAWVEVYFEGFGWVPFDPTPGRAPVGAEEWLEIEGDQQEDDDGAATEAPADSGQVGAPAPEAPQRPPGPTSEEQIGTGGRNAEEEQAAEEGDTGPIPDEVETGAKGLGLGILIYLVAVPLALLVAGWLRRARASSPEQKVGWAWQELTGSALDAGVRLVPSLTPFEAAGRLRSAYPSLGGDIDLVATWVEQVNYAEQPPSPEEAAEAMDAGSRVAAVATQRLPLHVRILRWFDARRLLPRTREARRSAHGAARSR